MCLVESDSIHVSVRFSVNHFVQVLDILYFGLFELGLFVDKFREGLFDLQGVLFALGQKSLVSFGHFFPFFQQHFHLSFNVVLVEDAGLALFLFAGVKLLLKFLLLFMQGVQIVEVQLFEVWVEKGAVHGGVELTHYLKL